MPNLKFTGKQIQKKTRLLSLHFHLVLPGMVDKEEFPEMNHLLNWIHPRADSHQIVEEFRCRGKVFQHKPLMAQGIQDVFGRQQPALSIIDLPEKNLYNRYRWWCLLPVSVVVSCPR